MKNSLHTENYWSLKSIEFFYSIPDDILVEIALNDWAALELLCAALAIDLQILKENNNESINNRRNLC